VTIPKQIDQTSKQTNKLTKGSQGVALQFVQIDLQLRRKNFEVVFVLVFGLLKWNTEVHAQYFASYPVALLYSERSPNFFVRGPHKLSLHSSRAGCLTLWDCFGICYILPNQKNFCKLQIYYFFIIYWQNVLAAGWNDFTSQMKWPSWAGFWPAGRSSGTPATKDRATAEMHKQVIAKN